MLMSKLTHKATADGKIHFFRAPKEFEFVIMPKGLVVNFSNVCGRTGGRGSITLTPEDSRIIARTIMNMIEGTNDSK